VDKDSIEYFQLRERQERAAAEKASNDAARRAHEELAIGYAALARKQEQSAANGTNRGA
jgi:hypothetical protein